MRSAGLGRRAVVVAEAAYQVFALLFAGQLTTQAVLGLLVARLLGDPAAAGRTATGIVGDVLREHPPAPFGPWRFAARPTTLGGVALPAHAPVLVDLVALGRDPDAAPAAFGGGPHACIGSHLARAELVAVVEVLRAEYPDARLAVGYDELRATARAGIDGSRLTALPVVLGRAAADLLRIPRD